MRSANPVAHLSFLGLQSTWLGLGSQVGAIDARIGAIIGGVITLVIGMVLASTVNTQAAATGSAASIGSFTGAQDSNDLIPLVYIFGQAVDRDRHGGLISHPIHPNMATAERSGLR